MKKSERINTIMRYINNRAHFTISEIMEEFEISRSTAIRDIREIEAMGLPLVAEVGRSGGYSVLKNAMLPAVHFTNDEVKALFVAFLATKNQQLPFLKSRQTITEKLIGLLSETQQDDLVLLNEMLLFQGTNPYNPDLLELSDLPEPTFEKLIDLLLFDRYLLLTVRAEYERVQYPAYLLHIYQENTQWFIEFFDLKAKVKRHCAVKDLADVEIYEAVDVPDEGEIGKRVQKSEPKENIQLRLGSKAILQYKKYHPYRAKLFYTHPFQLEGICNFHVDVTNTQAVEDAVNWLLFLGDDLTLLKAPAEVVGVIKSTNLSDRIS